ARPVDRLIESVETERSVGKVRQRVMQRTMLERGLHAPALGDVANHRHRVLSPRPERDLDRDRGPILAPEAEVGIRSAHQPDVPTSVEALSVLRMKGAQARGD